MAGVKKEFDKSVIVIICIIILVNILNPSFIKIVFSKINKDTKNTTADGFTIDSFNVILDVGQDNSVGVTEKITVNWYETGHHGIFRVIPTWLEYTGKNGKTVKRKSNIKNLTVAKEYFTIEKVGKDKQKVKIGSSNSTLPLGNYTYTIKYTYDMGEDPFNGFDEFIFHAYGDFWGTEIKNASIQINMPSSVNASNVKFWSDKKRDNNITSMVNYYVEGNSIYASVSRNYHLFKSLTVDIELPEGYFVGASNNYGTKSQSISIIIIIGAVIMFLIWRMLGKDHDKVSETIEFYPPEGLDAAQIGYIYGKQTSKKLSIALIIQLASKGYIKIEESEDKSTQRIINLYPDISSMNTQEAEKNKSKLQELTETEEIVYKKLFPSGEESTDISNDLTFYMVFNQVSEHLNKNLKDKIDDSKSSKAKKLGWIWSIVSLVMFLISFFGFEDLSPKYSYLYSWSFIATIISFVLAFFMGRKTTYGEAITAKVLGFRDYLERAEKQQIDALVEKNPNYFYDILPYAYVLDVSKKWIEKFEKIPEPVNDMGNFDYCDMYALDMLQSSIHIPVSDGGGGSSSCGGGCSSCGGGCSSCGGGGSW